MVVNFNLQLMMGFPSMGSSMKSSIYCLARREYLLIILLVVLYEDAHSRDTALSNIKHKTCKFQHLLLTKKLATALSSWCKLKAVQLFHCNLLIASKALLGTSLHRVQFCQLSGYFVPSASGAKERILSELS
jgi:hypothetical protein